MGIVERPTSKASTEKLPTTFSNFTKFDELFSKFLLPRTSLVDYVVSGDDIERRIYIFPTFSVKDEIGNIQDDPILDMALDLEAVLNDDAIYTREFGGDIDNRKYYFPRFRIKSDDSEKQLVCVIYPSKIYAEKVREADVLTFEKSRAPLDNKSEISDRIAELHAKYPAFEIPETLLVKLLTSE